MGTKKRTKPSTLAKAPRKKPETLRLRGLTPSITVNDLKASLAWYCDVLSFTRQDEWKHDGVVMGAEIKAGSVRLYLSQDDFAKGRDRVKGVGLRFICHTAQDVDRLAAGIEARGGVFEQRPTDQPWGGRSFSLADPDGFKVTIGT